MEHMWLLQYPAAVLLGLAALAGAWALRRNRDAVALLGGVIVIPIGVCVLLFTTGMPAFEYAVGRLHWVSAAASILAAAALVGPYPRILRLGCLLVLGLALAKGALNWHQIRNPAWDELVARIDQAACANDPVFVLPRTVLTPPEMERDEVEMFSFLYYWSRVRPDRPDRPLRQVFPSEAEIPDLAGWLSRFDRLWVPWERYAVPTSTLARVVAIGKADPRWQREEVPFEGVSLYLFERRGSETTSCGAAPR
jgi:hypothetical protein